MTKDSWCLLLEKVSVHAWGGVGMRDSGRGLRTPESLGSVNNMRKPAQEKLDVLGQTHRASLESPQPCLGSGRRVERKESQRSQLGKARHAAGRDLKKRGFGSPHVQEDTLSDPPSSGQGLASTLTRAHLLSSVLKAEGAFLANCQSYPRAGWGPHALPAKATASTHKGRSQGRCSLDSR